MSDLAIAGSLDIRPSQWGHTALALRGFNQTNLGRTAELLSVPAYARVIERWLYHASDVCSDVIRKPVDLLTRVKQRNEPQLDAYAEAVALVMAIEFAQLELLATVHDYPPTRARLAFGYSLGEVVATAVSGLLAVDDAMRVPLSLAADCAALAKDTTLAIVFSRREAIALIDIELLCIDITAEGQGTIGVSSILSPNSLLVIGQQKTVDRLEMELRQTPRTISVRRNPDRWPPLHTPIVRQQNVPDRAATIMAAMRTSQREPVLSVFSLTTGRADMGPFTVRETLRNWADHPQRLWDAVRYVLESGIDTVLHVGPEPNVVPATLTRLADNVAQQSSERSLRGYSTWAMSGLIRQRWLASVLPRDTALLRAPLIRQIVLEDWLLSHAPGRT